MAALIAYAAGLTTTGMEILSQALSEVFGEVSLQELGKDNLRYNVRMSLKSSSVVLVALDSSSEKACKDIENGLYSSDKYVSYTDDKGLTSFLNEKYGLSLDMPVDVEDLSVVEPNGGSMASGEELEALRESYEAQLSDRDALISNLHATVRELEGVIEQGGYSVDTSEIDSLKEDNMSLRSQLSDLKSNFEALTSKGIHTDEEYNEVSQKLLSLQEKLASLKIEFERVSQECADALVESSKKSGVIRDKDFEIARLSKQIEGLTTFVSQHQDCESKIANLVAEVKSYKTKIKNLDNLITSRNEEVERLQSELSSSGKTLEKVEEYRTLLMQEQEKSSSSANELASVSASLGTLQASYDAVVVERDSLVKDLQEVQAKLGKSDEYITQLNTKNIELNSKIRVLEQSTDRDVSVEDTLAELATVRRKYAELQGNIFNVLYSKAMPKSATRVLLFNPLGISYNNIRFVFSGSTESRKGTYKCLLNEIKHCSSDKYLLVDVVSETYVDYVFEINKMVNGLKWFTDGGGVQQYITQTVANNARVLSPGLGYINDSFYLTVDWEKRLQELEQSGYKVILYCGDITSLVGRVLFENFADLGKTDIYVHGNSVGSRTVLGVSRGVSAIKKATVKYFEYDPQMSKFVELMKQKCACEVVSSISR